MIVDPVYFRAADLSEPDPIYRYVLYRIWSDGPLVQWIGLNPSTADAVQDDPTIRKCMGFARRWDCGGICMTNLFAFRATDPIDMKKVVDPIGRFNDAYLCAVAAACPIRIACWGNHGNHLNRHKAVRRLIPGLKALRINGATGQPAHPLYIPYSTKPIPYGV